MEAKKQNRAASPNVPTTDHTDSSRAPSVSKDVSTSKNTTQGAGIQTFPLDISILGIRGGKFCGR